MQPGRYELTIVKGATFRLTITYKRAASDADPLVPVDLTGWSARSQVRSRQRGTALMTFDTAPAADELPLVLGSDGTIAFHADHETTSAIADGPADWSVEVEAPGGDRDVLVQGPVTILDEVTR